MNYRETVEFLFSQLPYFSRDGKTAIKKDLTNTLKLCEILGNPQRDFKCVHVAGTNGKGSVSNMLAAVFQEHGYKTGLYTSPHLKDFRERIRVNGEMVSETFVRDFTEAIIPHLETIKPSFFEITVAMCFKYFSEQKVDYAIIETGLGGRLDSTNIITPIISVITNIGMDHADLLGDTLPLIAFEKAGIIKPEIPVVIGESDPETEPVFRNKAAECQSEIYFADKNIRYYGTEIKSDLKGIYQQKNIITVLQTIDILSESGISFNNFTVAKALLHVRDLTHFRGRWEILGTNPLIVADTGHNAHGIALVTEQIKDTAHKNLHMVIGMVKDKDRHAVLRLLPADARYYFCKPDLFRALDPVTLKEDAESYGLKGTSYNSVKEALDAAISVADSDDMIFIGGSTFVVAEAL